MELTQNPGYEETPGLLKSRSLLDWVFAALLAASVAPAGDGATPCAILTVVLRQVTPSVRPDDILAALRSVAPSPVATGWHTPPPLVTREMQGPLTEGGSADAVLVGDPLAADREGDQT